MIQQIYCFCKGLEIFIWINIFNNLHGTKLMDLHGKLHFP